MRKTRSELDEVGVAVRSALRESGSLEEPTVLGDRTLMPVDAISGFFVAAIAACNGRLVRSAEATLKAGTPKPSRILTLVGSQGVHRYRIPT